MTLKRIIGCITSVTLIALQTKFFIPEFYELLNEPPEGDEITLAIALGLMLVLSLSSFSLFFGDESVAKSKFVLVILLISVPILGLMVALIFMDSIILFVSIALAFLAYTKSIYQNRNNLFNQVYLSSILTLLAMLMMLFYEFG